MRKNTETALNGFLTNKPAGKPGSAIWTDGKHIWSYATALVTFEDDTFERFGRVVVNMTKYSQTTTVHQNALLGRLVQLAPEGGVVEVGGLDRGVTPTALVQAARGQDPVTVGSPLVGTIWK